MSLAAARILVPGEMGSDRASRKSQQKNLTYYRLNGAKCYTFQRRVTSEDVVEALVSSACLFNSVLETKHRYNFRVSFRCFAGGTPVAISAGDAAADFAADGSDALAPNGPASVAEA